VGSTAEGGAGAPPAPPLALSRTASIAMKRHRSTKERRIQTRVEEENGGSLFFL